MIAAYLHLFKKNGIPLNTPDDVALYTQQAACDPSLNGKNVYVGGGKGFDIEEGLDRTLPQWLGQENLDGWKLQADVFGKVSSALSELRYNQLIHVLQGDWLSSN
jgi:hypothetical protein